MLGEGTGNNRTFTGLGLESSLAWPQREALHRSEGFCTVTLSWDETTFLINASMYVLSLGGLFQKGKASPSSI